MSGKSTTPPKTTTAAVVDQAVPQTDTNTAAAVTQLATAATSAISELAASAKTLITGSADQSATIVADRLMVAASDAINELVLVAKEQLLAIAATATPVQASAELVSFTVGAPEPVVTKLTAAEACQRVKRRRVYEDKGASREVLSTLSPSELLSWHDHGTHVIVVTTDGQKFSSAAAE